MIPESNFLLVRDLTLKRISEMLILSGRRIREYHQPPFLPLCKQYRMAEPGASPDRECRFCPLHDRGVRDCCTEMARLVMAARNSAFPQFLYSANRLYHRVSRLTYREYVRRFHFHQPVTVLHEGAQYAVCRTGERRKLHPGEWGLGIGREAHLFRNTGNELTVRPYDVVHLVFREEAAVRIAG